MMNKKEAENELGNPLSRNNPLVGASVPIKGATNDSFAPLLLVFAIFNFFPRAKERLW